MTTTSRELPPGTPAPAPALRESRDTRAAPRRHLAPILYLTEEEIDRLFGVITSIRDRAIFRIGYHRGLRAREIGMLQLADYSAKQDRLTFDRLKGSTGGEYHLCSSEVRALRAWLRERGGEPGPLFPSRRGRPISQQMLDVLMKKYCRMAGIPRDRAHFHVLKHSCATHLLNRGESIEDVQDHLGHRNIQNTLVYAKITSSRRQARDRRLREW